MKVHATVGLMLLAVVLTGCTTREPGIYKSAGTYYEWTNAPASEVSRAAFKTLDEQPNVVLITEEDPAVPASEIRAINRFGTAITVYIDENDNATSYGVNVNPGHSEGYSLTILNGIRRNLGLSDRK